MTSFVDTLLELNGNTLVSSNNYTHVTLFDPERKWSINDLVISCFWENYCKHVYNNTEQLYVAERNRDYMPTIFEMEFKYYKDSFPSDPLNNEAIEYMIAAIQEAICELFQISDPDGPDAYQELQCCVLISNRPWEKFVKDSEYNLIKLRLHFPYCKISINSFIVLRTKVLRLLHQHQVMSKFHSKPIGDWDTIIANDTLSKPLLMYGSSPNMDETRFTLSKIYGSIDIDDYGDIEQAEELYLDNVFNRRWHNDVQKGLIPAEMLSKYELDFWIPMLLSVNYPLTIVRPKEKAGPSIQNNLFHSEKLTIVSELLKIISVKRFQDNIYNKEIGKAIYNASEGDSDGLELWLSATNKALKLAKIEEEQIDIILNKMHSDYYLYGSNNAITERTLAWFAKEDNEERYRSWHIEWCKPTLERSINGHHSDVAEALYRFKWLEYICVDPAGPIWYKFHRDRMLQDKKGTTLKACISKEFLNLYEHMRLELSQKVISLEESREKDRIEDKIDLINKLIAKLKDDRYKTSIMKAIVEFYYRIDFNFHKLLDSSLEITGLPNGVLEVYENRCIIRKGKPEDYISQKTGVPYRHDFHWNHPAVKKYLDWLNCLHRDPELRWEWRKLSCSFLRGGNNNKIIPVITGSGNNGKTQMIKCWETAYGDYCFNYPVELLSVANKNPQGPSPATARGRGKRIAITTEPEDDDPLRKNLLKGISGGDRYYGRMLNDNGGDIVASFVMTIWCNGIPIFPSADEPFKERVLIYPFLSVWKYNAPESLEEQLKLGIFKRDKFFDQFMEQLAQAFLWVCVEDYPHYKDEGLKVVECMTQAIDKYWAESDIYYQYTKDNITIIDKEKVDNTNCSLTITEIYLDFVKWHRMCYSGAAVPDRRIFKREISKHWGEPVNSRWYGIILTEKQTVKQENGNGIYDFVRD